ncbi:MAG TPA: DUF924 family protein [Kangiella sp.]|uniref:DUF924 family protein n=1 Tax=Kangiella sp. TaxID=1920245 RepID=UPI002F939AE0
MNLDDLTRNVLDFWFGAPDSAELGADRAIWFQSDPQFDQEVRERFGEAHRLAAEGKLDNLMQTQKGALALIIILDQFSRNIYRNQGQAFATDVQAQQYAEQALEKGFDRALLTVEKKFFYMPFMHAEDLKLQEKSIELFVSLGDPNTLTFALCHRDQIVRFGRFPGRNQALGRKSTPAEEAFLKNPFC